MNITHIKAFEVVVPAHTDAVNSPAWSPAVFDEAAKYIVRIHTDAGLIGSGESQRGATREEVTRGARNLLGLEPHTLNLRSVRAIGGRFWPTPPPIAPFLLSIPRSMT